jgi:hypothetical protein
VCFAHALKGVLVNIPKQHYGIMLATTSSRFLA